MAEIKTYPTHVYGSPEFEEKLNFLCNIYECSRSALIKKAINIMYNRYNRKLQDTQAQHTDAPLNNSTIPDVREVSSKQQPSGGFQQEN